MQDELREALEPFLEAFQQLDRQYDEHNGRAFSVSRHHSHAPVSLRVERVDGSGSWSSADLGLDDFRRLASVVASCEGGSGRVTVSRTSPSCPQMGNETPRSDGKLADRLAAGLSTHYRCKRCGRDEYDAHTNGCLRGPCPMEFVG